jgi:hypothetical protein
MTENLKNYLKEVVNFGYTITPCFGPDSEFYLRFADRRVVKDGEEKLKPFWSNDPVEIDRWLFRGNGDTRFSLFRFRPVECGLLVFDLDRHPPAPTAGGELIDGVTNWLRLVKTAYLYAEQDIPGFLNRIPDFPVYALTPSGGVHLFFKLPVREPEINKKMLPPGVEMKFRLSDGRSDWIDFGRKKKGESRLIGHFIDAPELPQELVAYLEIETRTSPPAKRVVYDFAYKLLARMDPGLFLQKSLHNAILAGKSRNSAVYHIAYAARSHGISDDVVYAFVMADSWLSTLPHSEVLSALRSAYK